MAASETFILNTKKYFKIKKKRERSGVFIINFELFHTFS